MRKGESVHVKRTRPDWMMLETRSQNLGRGQRTVYEQAKTPELQNTVMDDRRADPQRVRRADPQRVKRAFQTAGQPRAKERQEHGQLQARTSSGRLAAASIPHGSSFRKGRRQDTWRDVTRTQEEDKDEVNSKMSAGMRVVSDMNESCGQHRRR